MIATDLQAPYLASIALWRELAHHRPALSAPHLVSPPLEYAACGTRLMIVGQEPLGWGEWVRDDSDNDHALAELLRGYDDFALGANYRRSPFWSAANSIFARLNPNAGQRSYLWSNLIKIAENGHRPSSEVEESICSLKLLESELKAYKPDVAVFFTGPRYDERLRATFPGVRYTPISKYVVRLDGHEALPLRSFRAYHPGYLRRAKQWPVIDQLASYCEVI